ncbi:ribosome maturation factor RimM [bacterium]|nr:ribosome maturation factor RimM [bacterium]
MDSRLFLQVGQIVKPHGVRGELGIICLTERPDLRFVPGAVLLAGPRENALKPLSIESVRPYRQGFLVCFEGVTDLDRAEAMRGWGLFIDSTEAAETEDDAWYHHELIGLEVVRQDGSPAGRVESVMEMPGQDLLEIKRPDGRSFMVPMVAEFVLAVDLEANRLTVRLPEGLEEL